MEFIDGHLYVGDIVPNVDRPVLSLQVGDWKGTVRYNADQPVQFSAGIAEVSERRGLKDILAIRIPVQSLGVSRLKQGATLDFHADLDSHGRGYKMSWQKRLTLN
jgi:hypothetical protein